MGGLQLEWESEDLNKLFAIIVYKNMYPRDFTLLQTGSGELYKALNYLDGLAVEHLIEDSLDMISNYEKELKEARSAVQTEVSDAKKIFIASLFSHSNATKLRVNHVYFNIKQSLEDENFDHFFETNVISTDNQNVPKDSLNNYKDKYLAQKKAIEDKSNTRQAEISRRIFASRSLIESFKSLHPAEIAKELISNNNESEIIDNCTLWGDGELVTFLVMAGHISFDYRRYISVFHKGSKTEKDLQFLRAVSSYKTLEPSFKLDNPNAVMSDLNPRDFGNASIQNFQLIDELVMHDDLYGNCNPPNN